MVAEQLLNYASLPNPGAHFITRENLLRTWGHVLLQVPELAVCGRSAVRAHLSWESVFSRIYMGDSIEAGIAQTRFGSLCLNTRDG